MVFRLLILLFFTTSSTFASDIIKGYKSSLYTLSPTKNRLCEYSKRHLERWCIDVQNNPMGMYAGFNQLLVYSADMIQAVDLLRQEIKWSISLKNVYKMHINYPVIVLFYTDRSLKGFDYFSGLQLWANAKSDYDDMLETSSYLWLIKKSTLDKLDIISGDVIHSIQLKSRPIKLIGDEINVFYQSKQGIFHYNIYNQNEEKINYSTINQVSTDLIQLRNNKGQESLYTFSNRVVSKNVQQQLFKVESPTRSYFGFIENSHIHFINKKKISSYEFTPESNSDKIIYVYRISNKLHVFSDEGKSIWTLRPKQKKSDQDT